jgi:hypothetical protein
MDLENFLQSLLSYQKKDPKGVLSAFFDYELLQLYKTTTEEYLNETQPNRKIVARLKGLETIGQKNQLVKHWVDLNYYFDHTYVLNLDRRPDRLNHSAGGLRRLGWFNWSRFRALDGSDPDGQEKKEWEEYQAQSTSQGDEMKYGRKAIETSGSWAILKSMYLMIQDAQRRKFKRILILQDDNLFHKRFMEKFLNLVQGNLRIPQNWKLLYLGATQYDWTKVLRREGAQFYFPMGTADGAFAVGIDCSVFQELLDEIVRFDSPVDSGALSTIQARYGKQCLVLKPNLIIADIRDSDLRESRDLGEHGKKLGWDPRLYRLNWEK